MAWARRLRRDLAAASGTVAAFVVLYPRAALRGESFFERDLHLDWYPRLFSIARCLREGSWPVWDRTIGFGQPLLADPGAQVAYPLAWPALLVPAGVAYTVFVLTHLLLAAVGTQRLARRLGALSPGAYAAAAFFVLGGPLQSALNLWHHFAGACWMPWVLLATDRAVRACRRRNLALLAAAVAGQLLAGSADLCAMTWAAAAAWAAFRLLGLPRRRAARAVAGLSAAAVLAVGLGAVVWWPALDVVTRSTRTELAADVRGAWAVPQAGLVRLVAPLDPSRVAFTAERWTRLYDRAGPPFLASLYLGIGVLGLCGAAVASRRRRRTAWMLLAVAGVCFAFAMGPHGPLYPLAARLIPPLRMFRYPSKAMLPAALMVALAGGLGVAELGRRLPWRRLTAVLAALAVAAGVALLVAPRFAPASAWAIAPLIGLAVAGLACGQSAGRLRPSLAAMLAAALAAADLLAAALGLHATAPGALVLAPPPLLAEVDRSRRLYVYNYHTLPGTSERLLGRPDPYRTLAPEGIDRRIWAVAALRAYLLPPSAGLFAVDGSYDLDLRGLYSRELRELTLLLRAVEATPLHDKLLRMGAVGTVVSLHRRGLESLQLVRSIPGPFPEPISVWRVPGAPARSWLVGCARVARGGAALRAVVDPDFDPSRQVVLSDDGQGADPGMAAECGAAGTSRMVSIRGDRVVLQTEASRPALLVLTDGYDPGWTATLDGRAQPLLRANVAFRAVAVPAGTHRVEMVYRPRAASRGAALSALALLALAAVWLLPWRRRVTRGHAGSAEPAPR